LRGCRGSFIASTDTGSVGSENQFFGLVSSCQSKPRRRRVGGGGTQILETALAAGIAADPEPVAGAIPLTCFSDDAKCPSSIWRSRRHRWKTRRPAGRRVCIGQLSISEVFPPEGKRKSECRNEDAQPTWIPNYTIFKPSATAHSQSSRRK
jgi:hypothetical protein